MKRTLITVCIVLCMCAMSISALAAEEGELEINAHVIRDTREDATHQRSIGHELAPTLFLEEKTEREALIQESELERFSKVQEVLFYEEFPEDFFSTEEITKNLFVEHPLETVRIFGDVPSNEIITAMPLWAIVILMSAGFLALSGVGILIGNKWAKRKRRELIA